MVLRSVALVAVAAIVTIGQGERTGEFTAVAERMKTAINAADYEAINREFNQQMKTGFTPEKQKTTFETIARSFGRIQTIDPPRFVAPDLALFLLHFERGALDMRISLDKEGKIGGLGFMAPEKSGAPAAPPKPTTTHLTPPVRGRWIVDSGGDTRELNTHHEVANQVYAEEIGHA